MARETGFVFPLFLCVSVYIADTVFGYLSKVKALTAESNALECFICGDGVHVDVIGIQVSVVLAGM